MPNASGAVTEREWQRTLTDALDALGWSWSHTFPLRTQHGWRTGTTMPGWPDLVALRPPYVVAIEAKLDTTYPTKQQRRALTLFSAVAGGRAWILRPRDDLQQIVGWLRDPRSAPRVHGFEPLQG